jgi:hypothetical protein
MKIAFTALSFAYKFARNTIQTKKESKRKQKTTFRVVFFSKRKNFSPLIKQPTKKQKKQNKPTHG